MKTFIFALILLISLSSQAQIPPVPAAFPNNACIPGQLLFRQAGMGRITNIAYHNGHIYTNNVAGNAAREFLFANTTDVSSFYLNADTNIPSVTSQGNHGHYKIGDIIASHWHPSYQRTGVGINLQDPPNPPDWVNYLDQQPAPDSGSIRIFYPWSVPFNWLQYGPTPATARLYRAEQLLAEWEPLGDHGIAGNSILLGNILFITSDATMRGIAAYDISPVFNTPPEDPILIDRLNGLIGGYMGAIWQDYIVLAGGSDRDILQVIDISDVTDMRLIKTFDLSGDDALNAGTNVPYVQTQDEFIFARRHKINMETLELVHEFDEVGNNRPIDSVSGQVDMSQYLLPLGNLLISGGYSSEGRDAIGVWCHDAVADTTGPYVGFHIPKDGQSNFPLGAPISLVIAEELETFTIVNGESLIVRPVGGTAIDVWHSFSHDGVLTITPKEYFLADTTYEVVLPHGGIKDAAGNGIDGYSFSFSTGNAVTGTNSAPVISAFVSSASPSQPNNQVNFSVSAIDSENDPIEYRFVLGDGTPATTWSNTSNITHNFTETGHFNVKVQVRDIKPNGTSSIITQTLTQTIINPINQALPSNQSMMALNQSDNELWVVNPDNNSVSIIDTQSNQLINEINLNSLMGTVESHHPTSLTLDSNNNVWVTLRNSNQIIILSDQGQLLDQINTGYGSRPQSVIAESSGMNTYVTLGSGGQIKAKNGVLVKYNAATRHEIGRVELGPLPRAMALTGNDSQLFIAEFLARENHAVIWDINTQDLSVNHQLKLNRDRGLNGLDSGGSDGPGVPNYISELTISPDHQWLWYAGIKADTFRGQFFQQETDLNIAASHDSTIRSVLGRIDLNSNPPAEPEFQGFNGTPSRLDIDNSDSPSSITFNESGDYVFVTLQGNNTLTAFDDMAIRNNVAQSSVFRAETGSAPQDSLFDPVNNKIWVKNFLSRNVTSYDLTTFFQNGTVQLSPVSTDTVKNETFSTNILAGKQEFYFAGNSPLGENDMSFEGYISCASCHLDGSHDGRVWDFNQRGEGFRNTTDLRGRRGTGHGNVHWSANFNEIQDFVLDIVNHFKGTGFLEEGELPNSPLGQNNTETAIQLDQISEYVSSLDATTIPQSPYRLSNGDLTPEAQLGEIVFNQINCNTCHNPSTDFTNSQLGSNPVLQNVGTIRDSSGQRLGAPLVGIDTPTLLGVWETAPYFHDGSAPNLEDVFSVTGGKIIQAEIADLSNGADIPGYIQYNYDSSSHGEFVRLPGTLILNNIDGGIGGLGALGLRVINGAEQTQTLSIIINGNNHSVDVLPYETSLDWHEVRLDNISWLAGESNQLEISLAATQNNELFIDDLIVATINEIELAQPHRQALNLNLNDFENLLSYLNQLDGSDSSFVLDDLIFMNGFD
ncbi:MAG: Ig-like domain-containing protein [Marinicellaceae bacterium]